MTTIFNEIAIGLFVLSLATCAVTASVWIMFPNMRPPMVRDAPDGAPRHEGR